MKNGAAWAMWKTNPKMRRQQLRKCENAWKSQAATRQNDKGQKTKKKLYRAAKKMIPKKRRRRQRKNLLKKLSVEGH
jgi:hypothetical protein